MKTFTILLLALVLGAGTITAEARDIAQGSIMITGETAFTDSSTKIDFNGASLKTDTTTFDVIGSYFVTSNIGIGLMISNEDSKTTDGIDTENASINMIGPIVTFSMNLNPDLNFVFNAGLFDVSGDMDYGGGFSADFDGDGTVFMFSLVYFITDSVAANIGLRRIDSDIDLTINSLSTTVSADMSDNSTVIGFVFLF